MADQVGGDKGFGDYFDLKGGALRHDFEVGEKVTAVVTSTDRNCVFIDVGARSEGIIDRQELLDADGQLKVKPGDSLDVYFLGGDEDDLRFGMSLGAEGRDASLWEAFQKGAPVEGRVVSERTGGFEVEVGKNRGFCPYSQIDLHRQEPGVHIGQKYLFKILEYEEFGDNLVLSRRPILEAERERLREELKARLNVGDLVEGRVTKTMPFGAFVALGGAEGLIPISELAWGRTENVEDVVQAGQTVRVVVRDIDWERGRISLSLRQALGDPWDGVEERYPVGTRLAGKVRKLMPFGAFVEVEPGVDGLVHISKLGARRRIQHPSEVVKEGDTVEVEIESIDLERKRIALSMESSFGGPLEESPAAAGEEPAPAAGGAGAGTEAGGAAAVTPAAARPVPEGEVKVGATVKGVVEGIKQFGVFVRLPGERTGLLHISQIDLKGGRDKAGALSYKYPIGTAIEVIIREISGDRISLSVPEKYDAEDDEADLRRHLSDAGGSELGNLGDAFAKLKL
ncbi:MAG: 30S ribosomal protein S1 [Lentisphaerae bacterium ADurb.BinA184]|nr:MAG: 30S ribosomal protein S1 [Lentisphaerae bacterium ADurb.BinA184]